MKSDSDVSSTENQRHMQRQIFIGTVVALAACMYLMPAASHAEEQAGADDDERFLYFHGRFGLGFLSFYENNCFLLKTGFEFQFLKHLGVGSGVGFFITPRQELEEGADDAEGPMIFPTMEFLSANVYLFTNPHFIPYVKVSFGAHGFFQLFGGIALGLRLWTGDAFFMNLEGFVDLWPKDSPDHDEKKVLEYAGGLLISFGFTAPRFMARRTR